MKTRATSFLLAVLAVVSLVLPARAADPGEIPEEFPDQSGETAEEAAEIEEAPEAEELDGTGEVNEIESAICLDGEPVDSVEYEIRGGICYVTISSFVSMLDPEAAVEEEGGVVRVSATTVTQVIPVSMSGGEGLVPEDAGAPEGGEPAGEVGAANVVTADLDLLAAVGGAYFSANGRYLYVDGGLIDLNGSAAAPVRQLARVFNLAVDYDSVNGRVLLDHQEGAEPYLASGDAAYDGDTLYWLSHIIYCESGNQPLLGKIAVGNVVMNRVNDSRFPNTIYDVLFQKNQFGPASSGTIYRDPNWESVVAAKLVMDGASVVPDALYFNGVRARGGVARTKTYVATIGDHAFYK